MVKPGINMRGSTDAQTIRKMKGERMKTVKIYDGKIVEQKHIDYKSFDETIRNLSNNTIIKLESKDDYYLLINDCRSDNATVDRKNDRFVISLGRPWPGTDLTLEHYSLLSIKTVQNIDHCYSVKSLVNKANETLKDHRRLNKINEFIRLAKNQNITFEHLNECIYCLEAGRYMQETTKKACEFLSTPQTFWNPAKSHLDYNFFRSNRHEIYINY